MQAEGRPQRGWWMKVRGAMEFQGGDISEPASPGAHYYNSSVMSLSVLAVLELDVPMDDSLVMTLLRDLFLPINPRFSSVMVGDENGVKRWKQVEVKLEEHVKSPIFPEGLSPECYDDYFNNYLSDIATDQLPQSRPLWEMHIVKYPTSNAAQNVIFKLHHSLGDGYSLMGALLSCLQRADNPSLPLTFPSRQSAKRRTAESAGLFRSMSRVVSGLVYTLSDFGYSLYKSSIMEDDRTPIRSGDAGVEFRPIEITTMTFSFDQIKEIKDKLDVTVNDVITGIIFYGARMYMQEMSQEFGRASSTAVVLLNTRTMKGYKSVRDMVKPDADMPWGNRFTFLHVPIPTLSHADSSNPASFVLKAHRLIKRKRNSLAVLLTAKLLDVLRKLMGPEAAAQYLHTTLKNSTMVISNVIGPMEQMAVANHPVRGLYFTVAGSPQSLIVTVVSYAGELKIAVMSEKGLIDPKEFKSCTERALQMLFKTVVQKN